MHHSVNVYFIAVRMSVLLVSFSSAFSRATLMFHIRLFIIKFSASSIRVFYNLLPLYVYVYFLYSSIFRAKNIVPSFHQSRKNHGAFSFAVTSYVNGVKQKLIYYIEIINTMPLLYSLQICTTC